MKKILSIVASTVLLASLAATTVSADPAKGQKLYLKKLKKSCGLNGAKMAAKHTQDEWEALKDSGKLEDEIKKICPYVKDVIDKYLPDMFDFFHEYGSDSGNVPSC
jgi:hypothetical protein